MKNELLFGIGATSALLAGCGSINALPPKTVPAPPTATLRPPGVPMRNTPTPERIKPSPFVVAICPDPLDSNGQRVIFVVFKKVTKPNGEREIQLELKPYSGSDQTRVKPGERLVVPGYSPTGQDGFIFPIGKVTEKATGKETIHFLDLGLCVTPDIKTFSAFFEDVIPQDIRPEQQAFNGKEWRYGADALARRKTMLNPQKGIIRGKSVPIFRG